MQEEQLERLEKNRDPEVRQIVDEYRDFKKHPGKKYYLKLVRMLDIISDDLEIIENLDITKQPDLDDNGNPLPFPGLKILGSKLFSNILDLYKSSPAIFEAIKQGMIASELIEPNLQAKEGVRPKKRMHDGIATP